MGRQAPRGLPLRPQAREVRPQLRRARLVPDQLLRREGRRPGLGVQRRLGLVPEGSSRSRAASELAEMFARADGETEALPDKGPDAAARSALEFLRRLTESLGLVE